MATIHIYTDANCEIFDFSDYVGCATKGKDNTIELIRGRHKLMFFNMENCIDSLHVVQVVDADNMVDFIELDFTTVKAERYSGLDKLGRIRQEYIDSVFKGTGGILGYEYDYSYHYFDIYGKKVQILGEEYSSCRLLNYSHGIFLFEKTNAGAPDQYIALNLNFERVEIEQEKIDEMTNQLGQESDPLEDFYPSDRIVAKINEQTGKYGFVIGYDGNERTVLPDIYDAAEDFDKSVAPVILHNEKCLIDVCGKIIAKINLPNYDDTRNGLPVVKDDMVRVITGDKQIGFFNQDWELVIPPKYYAFYPYKHFHSFFNGYCIICTQRTPGNKSMALIDKLGKIVSPKADFMWGQYSSYENCAYIIYVVDKKMGILSNSGKVIIPAEYEDIASFNEFGITAAIKKDECGNEYLCMIDCDNTILRMMRIDARCQIILDTSLASTVFAFRYYMGEYSPEVIWRIRCDNHNVHETGIGPGLDARYGVFSDKAIQYNGYYMPDYELIYGNVPYSHIHSGLKYTKTAYIIGGKNI